MSSIMRTAATICFGRLKILFIPIMLLGHSVSAQSDTIFRSFTVAPVSEGVLINFTVFKGISCTGVQIERSIDNSNFTEIHEFAGVCGAINTEESYSFLDENPVKNRLSFYRLDLGSLGLYSESRSVGFIDFSKDGFTVFPNPCSSNCVIYFSNPNQNNLQILLFDRIGKLILEEETTAEKWELFSPALSSGIYFFKINKDAVEKHSGKLVVF
ncbi:MAG: T9SS type A sorting domain-containing protein [Bacteroidetes bacterium]|nr:T9SS type A sorting domain-containing protein [Bacteroidota bacterium]